VKNSNIISNTSGQEAREARFAYRIAARLNERADTLDGDIAERLRFAREKALECARSARTAESRSVVGISVSGAALLGGSTGWWVKLASVLPLLALAAGLLLIQHMHQTAQISVAAEIDAELLADDLPPAAYSDAGFVEFLKTPRE
jgi:chemotaxis response regulator CheB